MRVCVGAFASVHTLCPNAPVTHRCTNAVTMQRAGLPHCAEEPNGVPDGEASPEVERVSW